MITQNSWPGDFRAEYIQRTLNKAFEDEHAFNLQGADKLRLGWMPFQMADFIGIMSEVVRETDGADFLEVGSGIGTKSMVARDLFGLNTYGIEYSEPLATVASQKGRGPVFIGDATSYPAGFYGKYDIIWMYRLFRDPVMQADLEQRIYDEARAGAIFAGAALENTPDRNRWMTIVDDYDVGNRGAWKKV